MSNPTKIRSYKLPAEPVTRFRNPVYRPNLQELAEQRARRMANDRSK